MTVFTQRHDGGSDTGDSFAFNHALHFDRRSDWDQPGSCVNRQALLLKKPRLANACAGRQLLESQPRLHGAKTIECYDLLRAAGQCSSSFRGTDS
jgi:hypothetical protein